MKGPWEERVQMLLVNREIVWFFKAPDSAGYGGKPRIDFIACDVIGRFIAIEVKSLPKGRLTFTVEKVVPAVQRTILDRVGESANGCAILAVGADDYLMLYNWRKICHREKVDLFGNDDFMQLHWRGPKDWKQHNLHRILAKHWTYEPGFFSGVTLPVPVPMTTPTPSPTPILDKAVVDHAQTMAEVERGLKIQQKLQAAFLKAEAERIAAAVYGTTTTLTNSGEPSPSTEPSLSISKPPVSVSTQRKKKLLEQRSLLRGRKPGS